MGNSSSSFATPSVRHLAHALSAERQALKLRGIVLKLLLRAAAVRQSGAEDLVAGLSRQSMDTNAPHAFPLAEVRDLPPDATSDVILGRVATLMRTFAEDAQHGLRARIDRLSPVRPAPVHRDQAARRLAFTLVCVVALDALVTACRRAPEKDAVFMVDVMGGLLGSATWQMGHDLPTQFWQVRTVFINASSRAQPHHRREGRAQEACLALLDPIDAMVDEALRDLESIEMAGPQRPPAPRSSVVGPVPQRRTRQRAVPY